MLVSSSKPSEQGIFTETAKTSTNLGLKNDDRGQEEVGDRGARKKTEGRQLGLEQAFYHFATESEEGEDDEEASKDSEKQIVTDSQFE